MGFILFTSTASIVEAATPSSGFILGYDVDGFLKQKDEFGVITYIVDPYSGVTPSFSSTLAVDNQTGAYDIILSTSSSISSSNGSKLSLDSSGNPVVILTNGSNELVLSDNSYLNFTQSSTFSLYNDLNAFIIDSSMFFSSFDEIKFRVYNSSDNILVKSNVATSITSSNIDSLAGVLINSKNSSIESNLTNTVVIGGQNILATQSNTVYLGNEVNINGSYTLPQIDGSNGQYLVTNGLGTLTWSSNLEIQNLSDVLSLDNNTGASDIVFGTSTSLKSSNSNTYISMDWGSTNSILISTDNGALNDSYILINKNHISLDSGSASITIDNGLGIVYTSDYSGTFVTNSIVSKKYVDGVVSSFLSPDISQVLTSGNNTQTKNLIMGTSTFIKSVNGGGRIDLDFGSVDNRVLISTDDSAQLTSYLFLDNSNIEILADFFDLTISDNKITTGTQGLKYANDYSSTYVNRSLVDKNYVDIGTSSLWNRVSSTVIGTGSSNYLPYWINTQEISTTSSLYLSPETTIDTIKSSIDVGTNPYNSKLNKVNNKLYVSNFNSGNVSVINSITGVVSATISVGINPSEIEIDEDSNLVWVTNRGSNTVNYINSSTDTVVGTVSVGTLPFGIEKVGNFIYVANQGSNNISIINTLTNLISSTFSITTPRTFAYDFDKNDLWVVGIGPDVVGKVDLDTNTITATISVGSNPVDITYNAENQYIYVSNYSSNNVSIIDTNTLSIIGTVSVGSDPYGITLDENTGLIYVSNFSSSNMTVIDGTSIYSTITTTGNPRGISYDSQKGVIYVSNSGLNRIQTIETISRNSSFIGLNTIFPKSNLDVNGKMTTNSIRITEGARKGYILTSDIGGNATWQVPILNKYSINRGFTASTTETINHNLETEDVIVQAYSSGIQLTPSLVQIIDSNSVDIMFSSTLANIKIVIIG